MGTLPFNSFSARTAGGNPPGHLHWHLLQRTKTRAINLYTSTCQPETALDIIPLKAMSLFQALIACDIFNRSFKSDLKATSIWYSIICFIRGWLNGFLPRREDFVISIEVSPYLMSLCNTAIWALFSCSVRLMLCFDESLMAYNWVLGQPVVCNVLDGHASLCMG